MSKRLIAVFVGLTVAVVMLASVLMPVLNDSAYEMSEKENNTTMYFSALKDYGGEVVITPTGPGLEIDGVLYNKGFIASSEYIIQFFQHSTWYQCDLYSVELGKITSLDLITIHEDGTITVVSDEVEYSTTTAPEYVFIPNINGDWGNYRATHYYATYGQTVYSMAMSVFTAGEESNNVLWFSKMKDGKYYDLNAYLLDSESNTFTPTEFAVTDRTDMTYNKGNYYAGTAVTVTWNGISFIDAYDFVFAPIEYSAPTDIEDRNNAILYAIPPLFIVFMAISLIAVIRRD